MAEKLERTRTPDRLQGAENASRAIANVLNFTLGQQIQREQQRKALEAVAQEQEFKKALQQQEQQAALSRLQSDLAHRAVADQRARDLERQKLDEMARHNKAMEASEAEQARALAQQRRELAARTKQDAVVESLSKSMKDRIDRLDILYGYGNDPAAQLQVQQILKEIPIIQRQLDAVRSGGAISPDFMQQVEQTTTPQQFPVREEFGIYTPPGPSFAMPQTYGDLEKTAKGAAEQPKSKPRLY